MFSDSEILALFEPGIQVSREAIAKSLNAYDISSKTELGKHLNRMRDDGLIVKVPDSRDWRLLGAPESFGKEKPVPTPFQSRYAQKAAKVNREPEVMKEPTKKQREAVSKLDEQKPAASLNDALLRVKNKLDKGEVVDFDDKVYALNFLGKILDPTIDALFQSIIGDLKRLQN